MHTNLGMLYREGHGPSPPYCIRSLWACIRSLFDTYAYHYREGHGPCPPYCRDYSAAYYHLDQAASRGDSDALLFLGLMIRAGEFVAPGDMCVMM